MAESKEKLKSLLREVKDEIYKAGLNFNIKKIKIIAPGPITSWPIDEEKMETLLYCWWECKLIAIMENSRDIP